MKNIDKNKIEKTDLEKELNEVFSVENKSDESMSELVSFFESARILENSIVAPKEILNSILEQIPEKEIFYTKDAHQPVKNSWWKMGMILVPSALLLTLVLIPEYQHAQKIALPTQIKEPIVTIEDSLYSIEDDSDLFKEEGSFTLALAESDITSDFNQPFYEQDI
ncbi:hypothetical protein IPJ63_01305 [Candidatus Nomurabacteria bacterium]|nr:MAG: hypothetical protein IPJ63_01305 [Candidatus Nomurabacteria bacterium]